MGREMVGNNGERNGRGQWREIGEGTMGRDRGGDNGEMGSESQAGREDEKEMAREGDSKEEN